MGGGGWLDKTCTDPQLTTSAGFESSSQSGSSLKPLVRLHCLLENDKLPPTRFLSIRVLEPTARESVKYLEPTLACESPWMDRLARLPPWETACVYFSIMVMLRGPSKLEDESAAAVPRRRARGVREQNEKHRRRRSARLVSCFTSWLEAFASVWGSQRSNN